MINTGAVLPYSAAAAKGVDGYANQEACYSLQRLEKSIGLAILASHHGVELDDELEGPAAW